MTSADFPVTIHGVVLYAAPMPDLSRSARRQAEQNAVASLVRDAFGQDAVIAHHASGAPYVDGFAGHISVSHGGGFAVLAVSPSVPVGVDVECWREQIQRVAGKFLSPEEQAICRTPEDLLRAWTAKEAVFKASGIPDAVIAEVAYPAPGSDFSLATLRGTAYTVTHIGTFPRLIALAVPAA